MVWARGAAKENCRVLGPEQMGGRWFRVLPGEMEKELNQVVQRGEQ